MTYDEWVERLEADDYKCAGVVNEIDRETVEDDPKYNKCQECGGALKYEGWLARGSYRALAICQNPECQETFEF